MGHQDASETSPLLQKPVSPSGSEAPDDIPPDSTSPNGYGSGDNKPTGDEESHADSGERAAQYEGMPEVKAKLKYILPAIGIGVHGFVRLKSSLDTDEF